MSERHRNADVIIAFAEGRQIQFHSSISPNLGWQTYDPEEENQWSPINANAGVYTWRIKPEKVKFWIATGGGRVIPGATREQAILNFAKAQMPGLVGVDVQACIEIEYEPGEGL